MFKCFERKETVFRNDTGQVLSVIIIAHMHTHVKKQNETKNETNNEKTNVAINFREKKSCKLRWLQLSCMRLGYRYHVHSHEYENMNISGKTMSRE